MSVKTYSRLAAMIDAHDGTFSARCEEAIHALCDKYGVPIDVPLVPPPEPRAKRRDVLDAMSFEEAARQHFTF